MKKITIIFSVIFLFLAASVMSQTPLKNGPIKRYYAGSLTSIEMTDITPDGFHGDFKLRLGTLLNFKLFRNVSFGSKLVYDVSPGRFIYDGNLQWRHSNGDWMVRVGRMPTVMWFLHDPDALSQDGQFIAPAEAAIPAIRHGVKLDYQDFTVGFYVNQRDSLEAQAGYNHLFEEGNFFKRVAFSGSYVFKQSPVTGRSIAALGFTLDTRLISATLFAANGDKQTAAGIVTWHFPKEIDLVATALYRDISWEHMEFLLLKKWLGGPNHLSYMLGASYQAYPYSAALIYMQIWINN